MGEDFSWAAERSERDEGEKIEKNERKKEKEEIGSGEVFLELRREFEREKQRRLGCFWKRSASCRLEGAFV